MSTRYKHSITISVDAALIDDANQLALALGESPNDDATFTEAQWVAQDGSLQTVQETRVTGRFAGLAQAPQPLVAPTHAPDVDLTAAERARAALSFDPPARAGRLSRYSICRVMWRWPNWRFRSGSNEPL